LEEERIHEIYFSRFRDVHVDVFDAGWVVSSTLAGAAVGSFTGGALADKIGRRRTFQLNALPLFLGTLLRCVIFVI